MRLVVLGMMGRSPFAGVAWQALHYLDGFRRLGCDVAYVEDTGAWPYDPERNEISNDVGFTVSYIERLMSRFGLSHEWAYVGPDGRAFGAAGLLDGAEVLVNLAGANVLRDEHLRIPVRIYLETDPVLPQIEVAQGRRFTIDHLAAHTHHFTYGENLGAANCGVPVERFEYLPTRQPVVLDWWDADVPWSEGSYTTVASWRQSDKDVAWRGETYYWSKDREFAKFVALPEASPSPLEVALACDDDEVPQRLRKRGWSIRDALALSRDILTYRGYILASRGEFSVAKDQNIRLRSGWFSDRSACYLAAGKPVVTQDTGFGDVLPTGLGLFAVETAEEAAAAIEEIERNYDGHSRAARELAEEYFDAERVLAGVLERAGVTARTRLTRP